MKKMAFYLLMVSLIAGFTATASETDSPTLRIMTYNIRMNTSSDGINAWPHRKDSVAEMIRDKYQADIVGVQEALIEQVHDLEERLPGYQRIGVGRDNGWEKGEHMAIYYRKDRFDLLQQNTFWLSATPEIPGVTSWNSTCNRIVTWAKFKDRKSGKIFYHFNTHFDHRSQWAREESAKLVWKQIQAITGDLPVVLTGDFNAYETNKAYAILTGKEPAGDSLSDLQDARYISKTEPQGPTATTVRDGWTTLNEPGTKIDYIFVRNGFSVLSHRIPEDQYNGHYPSDHLPVVAELAFPE